ncbi:MAG: acyltransferase family protein [Eubacterium sp.]
MSTLNNNKTRYLEIDILKGIAILLMVFDHVWFGSICHIYIQSFHMPLFFIVSGYLWNNRDVKTEISKKFWSLIIPYLFFGTLFLLVKLIAFGYCESFRDSAVAVFIFPTIMDEMPFNPALWFLPCMFLTSVLYNCLHTVTKGIVIRLFACIFFFAVVCIILSYCGINLLPFCISPTLIALLFFFIGDKLKIVKYKRELKHLFNIPILYLILFVLLDILLVLLNGSVDLRSVRFHNVGLYFINSLLGVFIAWNISNKIALSNKVLCKKLTAFISFFSKNSIIYVCTNQFFKFWIDYILIMLFDNDKIIYTVPFRIVVFVLVLLLCTMSNYIFKYKKMKILIGMREN